MRCLLVLATSVLIFSSLTASSASAGEGIQFVGPKMLINRDIGGERWAITVSPLAADDPAERNSMAITGNVLRPDGQPPAAIDCQQDSDFPDIGTGVRLTCRAKNACQTLSDSCVLYSKEWTELGEVVVPYSFFELPENGSAASTRSAYLFISNDSGRLGCLVADCEDGTTQDLMYGLYPVQGYSIQCASGQSVTVYRGSLTLPSQCDSDGQEFPAWRLALGLVYHVYLLSPDPDGALWSGYSRPPAIVLRR